MKHFINERARIVTEALDVVVALGHGKLSRLDGFPSIKVVVRADWDPDHGEVAVISGGGSGHEPSHAGWVGDGMLTAAVCGEIFASPSVDAVLAAIVTVTGRAGCLLVVKSYTGDRLNFGLAAEKARALGLDVEVVVVSDDIALPDAKNPRGIAGTLFVHKVAGHLAREGRSLAEVRGAAARVAAATASIGVALGSCAIPGQDPEARIGPNEAELGLGIHGEPGAMLIALPPIDALATTLMEKLEAALDARGASGPIALLVNDLGGVPPIEMAIATGAVVRATRRDLRFVVGPERLMTALDMKGFSVSAVTLTPEIEAALHSPVWPRAWPGARAFAPTKPRPLPEAVRIAPARASSDPTRRKMLEAICAALVDARAELDALDAKVGDGDTGTTFATAAAALSADLDALPFADAPALCTAIANRLSQTMGGSSGILLGILVSAMARALRESPSFVRALREGCARMQHHGGAREGDRTMLDALLPAITALESGGSLADARDAARAGVERTGAMTRAGAGRSSYVRENALVGVPDPGAVAVLRVLERIAP